MTTPSLIIPSAPVYDEGLLYGLNVYGTQFFPEPIPFTRATSATRTNAAGLIELAPYNLVQRSEEFGTAPWSLINGATIAADTTTAPNGTLTADTLTFNGTAFGQIQQAATRTTGDVLTLSIWMKSNTLTTIALYIGNDTSNVTINSSWQRFTITKTITSSSATPKIVSSIAGSVDIWGAQLVEGTDPLPYLKTETRLNRPRVDFSLGGCPNLLLEPQRTNLALQSSSFDSASWNKGSSTVTANSTISPSGIVDADTFAADGTSSIHLVQTNTISFVSGTTYTSTIYAKKNTNNFLQIISAFSAGGQFANFDLNLGVVGSLGTVSGSNPTASITSVGDGWYRCAMTFTTTATTSQVHSYAIVSSATSARAESNALNTSVFLWGAQLELGAYPTTYIPTTTASVTRNADSFTESNIFSRGMITAAGGTWFVELRNNIARIRDVGGLNFSFFDTLGTNGFIIVPTGGTLFRLDIRKIIAGVQTTLTTTTTDTLKIAIKWNGTTADLFVNGTKLVTSTAFAVTALQTIIANGTDVPKYINQMALYPTPLSDTECISLTTL